MFLPEHRAANKPTKEIEERCYRTAKVLLDIAERTGEDSFTGMPLNSWQSETLIRSVRGKSFPFVCCRTANLYWRPGEGFPKVRSKERTTLVDQ